MVLVVRDVLHFYLVTSFFVRLGSSGQDGFARTCDLILPRRVYFVFMGCKIADEGSASIGSIIGA
jgi:hypothetical protein